MGIRNALFALALGGTVFFLRVEDAYAHERWFVGGGAHAGERLSMDLTNWLALGGVISAVAFAFVVDRPSLSRKVDLVSNKMQRILPGWLEWRVLAGVIGITLIANSIMGVFLAPELALPGGGAATLARTVQAVAGLLLLFQVAFPLAGILVVAILPAAAVYFSPASVVDYVIEYAFLGVAFFLVGIGAHPAMAFPWSGKTDAERARRLEHLALTAARVGLGLTFVLLAVHNKLANPDIALTFLDKYPLNFMPALGFTGFSNMHFVFAAGITEVAVGLLLAIGVATRLVAAIVIFLMLTTLVILGQAELIGHLPLIGVALLLLYRGADAYRLALPGLRKPGIAA